MRNDFRALGDKRSDETRPRLVNGQPLAAARGPGSADSPEIMRDPLKILVVEDEKAIGHMIAMMLGGPASKVARAANGWEALIKIGATARPIGVVFYQHRIAREEGLQFVR